MKHILCFITAFILVFSEMQAWSELKNRENQADYVIIYHPSLKSEVERFAQWRRNKGLTVILADINDIYSDFLEGGSSSREQAIRDFISYTMEFWTEPVPKYYLLAGDVELLPSTRLRSIFYENPDQNEDSVSCDDFYTINKYQSNMIPDAALGRFPANTPEELRIMIDKTMKFEDEINNLHYEYDWIISTEGHSGDGSAFESLADYIQEKYIGNTYTLKRISLRDHSPDFGTKWDLFDALNEGTVFFNSYGHGSKYNWYRERSISFEDFQTSYHTDKPFILMTLSCSQSFDLKDQYSFIEKILLMEQGGAAAMVNAAGLLLLSEGTRFFDAFYSNLFENIDAEIGRVILKAKRDLNVDPGNSYSFSNIYTLLGDPALKIPMDYLLGIAAVTVEDTSNFTITNPAADEVRISLNLPIAAEGSCEIIDINGDSIKKIPGLSLNSGRNTFLIDTEGLSSGLYFVRLYAGVRVYTKGFVVIR